MSATDNLLAELTSPTAEIVGRLLRCEGVPEACWHKDARLPSPKQWGILRP